MNIIQELAKRGAIEKSKIAPLEYEAKSSGISEEEVALSKRIVSEEALFNLKSEILKVPLKYVSSDAVSLKILELIPEESAKYYKIIPISANQDGVEIGMVYPENLKAREALNFLSRQTGFNYTVFLISISNFEELLRKYRSLKKEVSAALEQLETELKEKEATLPEIGGKEEQIVEDAPISKMVAVILRHAVDGEASDVHIEPTKENVRIRFRLDGVLHSSLFLPLKTLSAVVARIKILCNLKIDETRLPQDGRFTTKIDNKDIDFRISTFPTNLGEKVVIRILDSSKRKTSFESLGLTGRNLRVIQEAMDKSYGMILSTGPTGSGKTTTLYSVLALLNKEESNVITLEDPVEYFMAGVNQSQVNPEIGYTFASGLRHILRQDPDIIMVGEIRDEETASLAIHSALTGHIVLSTLHTSNASGCIPRLIDMGIKSFLISPTVSIVIAQRLIRTLCERCKKEVDSKSELGKIIIEEAEQLPVFAKKEVGNLKDKMFYQAGGCPKCSNTGYSGRIGVFEILAMTKELATLILKDPSEQTISEEAKRQEMTTMKQDGIIKVLQGITSLEEVVRMTESK